MMEECSGGRKGQWPSSTTSALFETFLYIQGDYIKLQVEVEGEGHIVLPSTGHSIPSLQFNGFQMWLDPIVCHAHLKKCYGLYVQVYNVVTCYDPIHLLQGCCQHIAGVRHHLELNESERERREGHTKKGLNQSSPTLNSTIFLR